MIKKFFKTIWKVVTFPFKVLFKGIGLIGELFDF